MLAYEAITCVRVSNYGSHAVILFKDGVVSNIARRHNYLLGI